MAVAPKFEKVARESYADLVALSARVGGVTASIASRDDRNVPNALRGEFVITGSNKLHTATNLASAIVTLRSVHNTKTVWLVENGKRTRVIWK